ncbi:MAG: hypothetical protein ACD_78C00094G0002 [uncultured bacterium (gcode 4)]|uniref:Uncharacterized protein n=1 Tax=uncultured bacterium (gcode 4) TaxID=1234023 RepID=K1XIW4_9BACT|nr:MAG: hypothetical protein ACD_78C00094G0002 [uncultured bacterium (gcode 4)]
MHKHLITGETLIERSKRLGATDAEFIMVPWKNKESQSVTGAHNELIFEGKILSSAEMEARRFAEMSEAIMAATNRAFDEGRMFK